MQSNQNINKNNLSGNDYHPTLIGGYISIKKDGKEFHIASVPSLMLGNEFYCDNPIENHESFEDETGNHYVLNIFASHGGIHWELTIESQEDLAHRIQVEFEPNGY